MTTTRLYLVRHGATQLSVEDRFAGDVGVELSEEGRSQAERLAARVRDDGISAIYSSPFSRAVETARIIARGCGLEPTLSDGLHEIRHGHWEGLTRRDVETRFAAEYAVGGGSLYLRARRWRVGRFGAGARPSRRSGTSSFGMLV